MSVCGKRHGNKSMNLKSAHYPLFPMETADVNVTLQLQHFTSGGGAVSPLEGGCDTVLRPGARFSVLPCHISVSPRRREMDMSLTLFQSSSQPRPGDLIEIFRGAYQHWAIYIGNGYVIHLTSDGGSGETSSNVMSSSTIFAVVKKERLSAVAGSSKYHVNNTADQIRNRLPVRQILQNAEAQVGNRQKYNVTAANCEHFVKWLCYGKAESRQAENAVAGAGVVGVAAAVGIVGAIAAIITSAMRQT
ncbi:phospholipase A and acyltransferase 3-like isoform X1 [Scyliorhinus torazame]|uniref:phospholipase A and acyltransferase 3-like isoform X1 n=2 Tax=Scyliorhinus torazame TaxID=75743 RepID=UPI003B5A911D